MQTTTHINFDHVDYITDFEDGKCRVYFTSGKDILIEGPPYIPKEWRGVKIIQERGSTGPL